MRNQNIGTHHHEQLSCAFVERYLSEYFTSCNRAAFRFIGVYAVYFLSRIHCITDVFNLWVVTSEWSWPHALNMIHILTHSAKLQRICARCHGLFESYCQTTAVCFWSMNYYYQLETFQVRSLLLQCRHRPSMVVNFKAGHWNSGACTLNDCLPTDCLDLVI